MQRLDLDHTVLRPNLYMQALLGLAPTIAHGWFAAPIGTAPVSAVDTRDIAESAAAVLTGTGHTGRTYTLTGPRAVTHHAIAEALAGVLPPWQLEGLVEDYAHYARGEAAEVHTSVADLTGHPARDITDFARDYAAAFSPA